MEHLYAPWRMAYIGKDSPSGDECIFCSFPKKNDDERYLILWRGKSVFALMNAFPYNNGHLMVTPYRHVADFGLLEKGELLELMLGAQQAHAALKKIFSPDGFNMGINLGRSAGAGIDKHLHLHIVPRWEGDTNFMTTIAQARVLPEELSVTYHKIRSAWPSPE